MAVRNTIASNFRAFATIFSPQESGGVLNYLFEPVNLSTNGSEQLLQVIDFSQLGYVNILRTYLLSTEQSTRVLRVLPEGMRTNEEGAQYYPVAVGLTIVTFIVTLALLIASIVVPLVCSKHWKRAERSSRRQGGNMTPDEEFYGKSSDTIVSTQPTKPSGVSTNQRRAYFGLGVTVLILLVFLIFSTVFAFYAVDSVVQNFGKSRPDSLSLAMNDLFTETRALLKELPINGTRVTDETVVALNGTIYMDLSNLVNFIMGRLLKSYGAKSLLDQAQILVTNVTTLEKQANLVAETQKTVLGSISHYAGEIDGYRKSLETSMTNLCPKLTAPEENVKCQTLKSGIVALVVKFDANQILIEPSIALGSVTSILGLDLSNLIGQFDQVQQQLDKQSIVILNQIASQIDLTQQLSALTELWTTLADDVTKPTTLQLDSIQPTIDTYIALAGQISGILGYVTLVLSVLIVIILLIYFGLCVSEAHERDFLAITTGTASPANTASGQDHTLIHPRSRHCLKCGFILPVTLMFLSPLVILILGVLSTAISIANNEACRYVYSPNGVRITDATLNLYLRNIWPGLIANLGGPETAKLLQISIPRDPITSLQVKCKPAPGSQPQPGLLPSFGTTNMVNVSAVLTDPVLLNTIKEFEGTLTQEVLKIDFAALLPKNLDSVFKTIENMTSYLDGSDYADTINELRTPWLNETAMNAYLTELDNLVTPHLGTFAEAITIRDTVKSLRVALINMAPIEQTAEQLALAFADLQNLRTLSIKLQALQSTLKALNIILTDPAQLEKPIRPAYQAGIFGLMANLSVSLPEAMIKFTTDVLACDKVNIILNTAISLSCGEPGGGILNRLGGMCFLLLLQFAMVILAVFVNQLFLVLHQKHCLFGNNQGVPLYVFTRHSAYNEQ